MPEVPAVAQAERPIIDVYRAAWERIEQQQQSLIDNPLQARKRARLREMRAAVERIMLELDNEAAAWISQRLPEVYAAGGATGAASMGAAEFLWTAISQKAVEELAFTLYQELLDATSHVTETTKALIREIGRDAALRTAIDGRTAQAAGREMRRIIESHGIYAVRYSNGARHGLAEYSEMAIRTITAKAYNYGILNGAAQHGCEWWEVFDGPDCGWSAHDSPELALGKIVSRDEAFEFPIAHPNCRRTFGPRPDLSGPAAASEGQGQVTPGQVAAQRAQDAARQERQARRALRNRQTAERRAARSPRSRVEKRASRLRALVDAGPAPAATKAARPVVAKRAEALAKRQAARVAPTPAPSAPAAVARVAGQVDEARVAALTKELRSAGLTPQASQRAAARLERLEAAYGRRFTYIDKLDPNAYDIEAIGGIPVASFDGRTLKVHGPSVSRSSRAHQQYTFDATPEGIVTHEYGHMLLQHSQFGSRAQQTKISARIAAKKVDPSGELRISEYGTVKATEWEAEAFAAYWSDLPKPDWIQAWGKVIDELWRTS